MRLLSWLLLLAAASASAQAELPKAPRVALEAYLSGAPAYRLLPDSAFFDRDGDDGALPHVAPDFRPYWRVGDFNGDGVEDFAALVFGPPAQQQRAWGGRTSYEARALVFNGQPDRTYHVAAELYGEIPYTSALLQPSDGELGYGVSETDALVLLIPEGDGYRVTSPFGEAGD